MAKKISSKEDLQKKIQRYQSLTKTVKTKEEQKSDKIENTFISSTFPIIIIGIIAVFLIVFSYLFNTYKAEISISNDGFMLSGDIKTLTLGTKKKDKEKDNVLNIVGVKENDVIYRTPLSTYLDNDKDKGVNVEYPLFTNDGLTIVNYNDEVNLINEKFERSEGYSNLILSYGKAFDMYDYNQIDKEHYLLMAYKDNINVNLYDMKIETTLNEYKIPTNSFIYFEKDKISYYERKDKTFVYKTIEDADFNTVLTFYAEGLKEEYEYNYEAFLEGLGTIFIKRPIPNEDEEIKPDKPQEEDEEVHLPVTKPDPDEFVYVKPIVNLDGDFKPNVYSMTNKITIKDPAGVIVKAPTFTVYQANKVYLTRKFYNSGNISINGLIPETTFTIVGKYTYLAEDMETKKIVTFYTKTITTKDMSSLTPITINFENGQIYPKKIEINNVKITSDLNDEAVKGIQKAAIKIKDTSYLLTSEQLGQVINGIDTTIGTGESLESSSIINYKILFLDRAGNEIPIVNNTGQTRTSKRIPSIIMKVKTNEVDSITLTLNLKNEDKIPMSNYKYVITNSLGKVVQEDYVEGSTVVLSGIESNQLFTIKVTADIDIDDGTGVKKDYELAVLDFTSKPIESLGNFNLTTKQLEVSYDTFAFEYSLNSRKTDEILTKLLKYIQFDLVEKNSDEVVETLVVSADDIEKFKNKEKLVAVFSNLKSDTDYIIRAVGIVEQGKTTYTINCISSVDEFITTKRPAMIHMTSTFTTETMIDFDVHVEDIDNTILSDTIRVELRDAENNIVNSQHIAKSTEPYRITYNNLDVNRFYTINFYADEYNETRENITYKTKYLLKKEEVYTSEGISGKIELISSLREPTGKNVADIKSNIKWIETIQYYNIPKTVDKDDQLHIYSKTGAANYAYDLSQYDGEFVTVSFKVKGVTLNPSYKLYFTNYYTSGTSSSYAKELKDITTDNFKEFSYTYKVGATSGSNGGLGTYSTYNGYWAGSNVMAYAGFYITGGNATMTEYVVKDFQVQLAYTHQEYDYGDPVLEQGGYSGKTKTTATNRIRMNKPIELAAGHYYSFEFTNNTEYSAYAYIYNKRTNKLYYHGWFIHGYTTFADEDMQMYLSFRRNVNGTDVNLEPDEIPEFKILQYEKLNTSTSYEDFKYELVTKTKINVVDKRDEIEDGNYYISIYDENHTLLNEVAYNELEGDLISVENIIKEIELEEHKSYSVELRIKIRDRYYTLSYVDLTTDEEILGISTIDEWKKIQPNGNYIILNDLDLINYTEQRLGWGYRYFHGTIDFQGYKMIVYSAKSNGETNTAYQKFARIETDAIIKNLVLELHLNNNEGVNNSVQGIVGTNYGTIENVMVNIHDTHNEKYTQVYTAALVGSNALQGRIRNFVLKLDGDLALYYDSGALVRLNYGTIENGYVYGGNVTTPHNLENGADRRHVGIIQRYGGAKSVINHVYSLSSVVHPQENKYDRAGILTHETYGKILNSWVKGDTNINQPERGPLVAFPNSTAIIENAYYVSDNTYTSSLQTKATALTLTDAQWQKDVLGEAFNVDELIELGYYPQIKFTSNKMPPQEYIELPAVVDENLADIISMKVKSKTNNSAIIEVGITNIMGEQISEIVIAKLKTKILEQKYENQKTTLLLEVTEPQTYASKYEVISISSKGVSGYTSTREYEPYEKYLFIDFYKEVTNADQFQAIANSQNENYAIMNDIDFTGKNVYIGTFKGKLEGNNHTLSNIDILGSGKNGLIYYQYGTIQNLNFENVRINNTNVTYMGLFGYTTSTSNFKNISINNVTIEVPEGTTKEGMMIGALIGNANYAKVSYVAANNVKIRVSEGLYGINVGGLIGYSYGSYIDSTFVNNVDIRVDNVSSSNGVGGLLGREAGGSIGILSNSYSTGTVHANTANTGGLVGQTQGYVENCYSTVNVSSELSYIGGIAGLVRGALDTVQNSVYFGNVYSSSDDINIGRINGSYDSNENNYSMDESLINGEKLPDKTNGEQVIPREDWLRAETYENFLGDAFYYGDAQRAVVPKLYKEDYETLMPLQTDNYLFENILNIKSGEGEQVITVHADSAEVTLYLENPDGYEITAIEVDDARTRLDSAVYDPNRKETFLNFTLYPDKYFDNYRLSKIHYKDAEGNEHVALKDFKIKATFFKTISNMDQWNAISTTIAENYKLDVDLDFTNLNVKKGLMFNRLISSKKGEQRTITGLNVGFTAAGNYHSYIKRINNEISDIAFNSTTITDATTGTHSYVNLILFNYGEMRNLTFNDLKIIAPNKHYVGIVGHNTGNKISDITLNVADIQGKNYTGTLFAKTNASPRDKFEDITATEITVTSTGNYVGGVFGYFDGRVAYNEAPIYNRINISNSSVTGYEYVGGVAGAGDANHSIIDNVTVTGSRRVGGAIGQAKGTYQFGNIVRNSHVYGSEYYIGGMYGINDANLYDMYVMNTTVDGTKATTHSVGGLVGHQNGYTITRLGVIENTITNQGDYTGGIVGYKNGGYTQISYVDKNTIIGNNYVGSIVGRLKEAAVIYYIRGYNNNVAALTGYAGGILGWYENNNASNSHAEGYVYNVVIEDTNVVAPIHAGGLFGKMTSPIYIPNRVYSLFFSGNISADQEEGSAGPATGDEYNRDLLNRPRIYFYDKSKINAIPMKDIAIPTQTGVDLLPHVKTNPGYIGASGVPIIDDTLPGFYFTDLIELKKGLDFEFHVDYLVTPNHYKIYVYNSEKTYVSEITSSSVLNHIEKYYSGSYAPTIRFKTYKDIYIRIAVNSDRIIGMTLKQMQDMGNAIPKEQLLSSGQLKNRVNWTVSLPTGNTTINATKLNLSSSYFDFTPLSQEIGTLTPNDLSGNGIEVEAYVSSAGSDGYTFDGSTDNYANVNNYVLSDTGNLTFQTTLTNTISRNYQWIFSSRNHSANNNGFGIFVHGYRIYVWVYNTWIDMEYYIPSGQPVNLAVTYETIADKDYEVKLYADGQLVKTSKQTTRKLVHNPNTEAYIAYDKQHTSSSNRFQGTIEYMAMYDRALTQEEIQANIASSSYVTDVTNLDFLFDFTDEVAYTAYYPIIKSNNATYPMQHQRLNDIPNGDINTFDMAELTKFNLSSNISDHFYVYNSGIDTINVEFDTIVSGMSLTYKVGDKKYKSDVNRKVYTLGYDYNSDIEITVKTPLGEKTVTLTKEDLANNILVKDNNYYNIDNKVLYKNGEKLINNALNIKDNLVLLTNGSVYNLNKNETQNMIRNSGITSKSVPLYTSILEGTTVKTYYAHTLVDSQIKQGQIIINNNELYMFNLKDSKNDNLIFNHYNNEEYQASLTEAGTIESYKTNMKYPKAFVNKNIKSITFDKNTNDPIMMVLYDSGNVSAFNYVTGEVVFEYNNDQVKVSLFDFISSSMNPQSVIKEYSTSSSFKESKELVNELQNINNEEVKNKLNSLLITNDNKVSNKLSSEYVVSYNENTNAYEVYNVNELLAKPTKETTNDEVTSNTTQNKVQNTNKVVEVPTINQKIEGDIFLYSYFYLDNNNTSIKDNKLYIYIGLICLVLVNLIVLSFKYGNKEIKAHE